ncbi:MAG: hypothetical protein KC713_02670, partial [Candidatus Omnitrophica bacterium]|nr:hypothetical protein [Candidatus Omnitrophota bacterium]
MTLYVSPKSMVTLPPAGALVPVTEVYNPTVVRGINIDPVNPLLFDFLVERGDPALNEEHFKEEATKLINYFLVSLTIPEDQMWVNLSPYESNRIIPQDFGRTEMGRELLALDYMLKQLSSSLMHPDKDLGV